MSRTEARHRKNGRSKTKHPKHFTDRNYHHLQNRCNGGSNERSNLLLMKVERHWELHRLFGNLNLDQIIALLQRVRRAKQAQAA